ncbi:MAG TPA: carboxypeptidase-like regulatory domain-containing protein [Candidatus Angelobacter sp.]|nr:carboxypeptidase-like regulatory domain-containing protein [Candidatus Angelobacter sp.]
MQSILVVLFLLISLQDTSRTLEDEAAIHGTVKDPNGAVISSASVRINRIAENGDSSGAAPQSGRQRSAATDVSGQFSVKLPAGSYQVCVTYEGFTVECQTIKVEKGQDVAADFSLTLDPVWEKEHGRADSEVMDQRLRALAGAAAIDCGHVQVKASPASATKCAVRAFRQGKPFVVRYDIAGIDSELAGGFASNGDGDVYGVLFDSMGMSGGDLKDGETMPDGSHTFIMPCPRPARIRVNKYGRATCFKKKSRNPLWMLDEE